MKTLENGGKRKNEGGRAREASVVPKVGPERRGPGPRGAGQDRVRTGSPEPGQEPGAGTHGASRRRGLLCSAYPWGGRGAGAARPPPPCRLSNSTSGLEEKREGRWGGGGGGGERAPGSGGAGGGRRAALPAGTLPGRVGAGNRSDRNFPPSGRGAGRSAERPRGGGPGRGDLGAHGARGR